MSMLLSFLLLAALVAAILGLIKPGLVLPFLASKHRTRPKAFGLYAAVVVLCALLLPAVAPKNEADVYLAQLKEEAKEAEKMKSTATASPAIAKASAEQISADRETVRNLYAQLMQFKDDPKFHQFGFGAGLPYAHQWLQNVKEVDSHMSLKKGYSLSLASSAGYLQQLGMEYMRSSGQENQLTHDFRGFVEEGLNK